jgi:arsenite-transporting ATPase
MVMGKGGVGKTTIAAAIAVALADRGHRVHLSTTDPAGRVQDSLASRVPNLTVSRIDPVAQTQAYRQEVLASAGQQLDQDGYRLLEEELRSPCTEEIAVFRAFADIVAEGKDGFVILDTAPTGHTLLLLDATEAYHRQVSHTMSDLPESVRQLLPRLRDPGFTHIIIATLPEATPVHEAAQLQRDLRRAEISPHVWVINQCLSTLEVSDSVLRTRQAAERQYIDEVRQEYSLRTCVIPWMDIEPVSPETLRQLVTETRQTETADTHSSGR